VSCNVTDHQGNGLIDVLDSFCLTATGTGDFSNSTEYMASLLHVPSGNMAGYEDFVPGSVPTSNMTISALYDGLAFTFGPAHTGFNQTYLPMSTRWDDVGIELRDGNKTVTWSPSGSLLRTGARCTQSFASVDLSNITIYCNITDLDGNGYLNRGDEFSIRTAGPDRFLQSEDYTLRVIYEPYDGDVFSYSFRG
jgi:hypothetical protein